MASFKPTKIPVFPKLGEKITEDTLYWKNYKVRLFFLELFKNTVLFFWMG